MASVDRHSTHAILKRASKTVSRALYKAHADGHQELADDISDVRHELYRLVESTKPLLLPDGAPPGNCA